MSKNRSEGAVGDWVRNIGIEVRGLVRTYGIESFRTMVRQWKVERDAAPTDETGFKPDLPLLRLGDDEGKPTPKTLPEKYAVLAAIHDGMQPEAEQINPWFGRPGKENASHGTRRAAVESWGGYRGMVLDVKHDRLRGHKSEDELRAELLSVLEDVRQDLARKHPGLGAAAETEAARAGRLRWLLEDMLLRLDSNAEPECFYGIQPRLQEAGEVAQSLGFHYPPVQQWAYPRGMEFWVLPDMGDWLSPPEGIEQAFKAKPERDLAEGLRLHDPTSEGAIRGVQSVRHADICLRICHVDKCGSLCSIWTDVSDGPKAQIRECLQVWLHELARLGGKAADRGEGAKAPARPEHLPARCERALTQYQKGLQGGSFSGKPTDRQVYDWCLIHLPSIDSMPQFATWQRYLREARRHRGLQKNLPRRGRDPGPSVVRRKKRVDKSDTGPHQ